MTRNNSAPGKKRAGRVSAKTSAAPPAGSETAARAELSALLSEQKFGVLATLGKAYPYQNIVAFAAPDIARIFFATGRSTSKYGNLKRRPRATLFIDNRGNREGDLHDATGMTALGDAGELRGPARAKAAEHFLRRHPYLDDFVASPDCALFDLRVRSYYIVRHFQDVREVRLL
jgi:hypothetical protein